MLRTISLHIIIALSITLTHAYMYSGTVSDEKGQPLPGAQVFISDSSGIHEKHMTTGDDGHYSFSVAEDELRTTKSISNVTGVSISKILFTNITIYLAGYAIGGGILTENAQRFTLSKSSTVSGTIVDQFEKPADGVAIILYSYSNKDKDNILCHKAIMPVFTAYSGTDGKWQLAGVPNFGTVRVLVFDRRYINQFLDISYQTGVETTRITVLPGATINEKVCYNDGTPAKGIIIYTDINRKKLPTNMEIQNRVATTDANGNFSICGLVACDGLLSFEDPNKQFIAPCIPFQVSNAQTLNIPQEIVLSKISRIKGTVTDAVTGKPIPNVVVVCRGALFDLNMGYTTTNSAGIYEFNVISGTYRLFIGIAPKEYINIPSYDLEITKETEVIKDWALRKK